VSEQEEIRDDAPPRDEDDDRWQMDPSGEESGQQDPGFEPAASPHEGEEGQRDDVA
jgi:hypothetical protein